MSEYVNSPVKSSKSPKRGSQLIDLSDKDVKDIIDSSFSKFNFHFQQLNDKYRIKMEDLNKRIEELDVYVNQYFEEENSQISTPQKK